MWSNLWDVWCPSVFLSTEWVSDYVCVCVSTTVLLVSSYGVRAMCRNGPLCCLACRTDPDRSTPITAWNLNVKHGPLLKPFVFLCGSVGLEICMHANPLTCSPLTGLTCTNIIHYFNKMISNSGPSSVCSSSWTQGIHFLQQVIYATDWLRSWLDPAVGQQLFSFCLSVSELTNLWF